MSASGSEGTPRARLAEERGVVGKVIVITLVVIVVVGLALVDAGSIVFAKISLEDKATTVAADAARELAATGTERAACDEAQRSLDANDAEARLVRCDANRLTGIVSIRLSKVASTLIVQNLDFLKKLGQVKATATAGPPTI